MRLRKSTLKLIHKFKPEKLFQYDEVVFTLKRGGHKVHQIKRPMNQMLTLYAGDTHDITLHLNGEVDSHD